MRYFFRWAYWANCLLISCFLLSVFLVVIISTGQLKAQSYRTADDVPNPKDAGTGYITDATGVLNSTQTDSLNYLLQTLDQKTGVEAAVVIISDFETGSDDFEFATQLFRKWGIGKKNADNGLLLLIVTGRRQYRFITGYGLEGLLPDADLRKVGDHTLVPAFRQQQYGNGILGAFHIISTYLQQPANKKELNTLLAKQGIPASAQIPYAVLWLVGFVLLALAGGWQIQNLKDAVPKTVKYTSNIYADVSGWVIVISIGAVVLFAIMVFLFGSIANVEPSFFVVLICLLVVLYFFIAHLNVLSRLRKHYQDDLNFSTAVKSFYRKVWWQAILSPFTLIFMLIERRCSKQLGIRFTPPVGAAGTLMARINRDDKEKSGQYLSAGQFKEEQVGSYVYDIWVDTGGQTAKLIQNQGYNYKDFGACPKCSFRTLTKPMQITLQKATYTHRGKAKEIKKCRNCDHEILIKELTLPVLTRASNSSSSSGSGSSSSSSSSSGSGSWGGGRTGGGGAGGSW